MSEAGGMHGYGEGLFNAMMERERLRLKGKVSALIDIWVPVCFLAIVHEATGAQFLRVARMVGRDMRTAALPAGSRDHLEVPLRGNASREGHLT